ncbi:MAG: 50S ribosomal protein L30 [Candidatus Hodarchaeales archaeon]
MSTIKSEPTARLAVIRIRSTIDRSHSIKKTLEFLRLNRTNHCIIIDDRKTYKGMLQKAKDLIAWGELNEKSLKELLIKRGKVAGGQKLTDEYVRNNSNFTSIDDFVQKFLDFKAEFSDIKGLKPIFRLHPPRKGHALRGVKQPYTLGGALGYRGKDINNLISKMA